jgi:response regulator RpfG family c-di-GMP phosphodiesterase
VKLRATSADKIPVSTILVVDDVAANRALLVTFLRHQGHRLLEAAEGRETLAAGVSFVLTCTHWRNGNRTAPRLRSQWHLINCR